MYESQIDCADFSSFAFNISFALWVYHLGVIGTWKYWTDEEYCLDEDGSPVRIGCIVEITEFDYDNEIIEGKVHIYTPIRSIHGETDEF